MSAMCHLSGLIDECVKMPQAAKARLSERELIWTAPSDLAKST
ncbi:MULTISPECIES: hypothetical protein [Paenochrobactrum]